MKILKFGGTSVGTAEQMKNSDCFGKAVMLEETKRGDLFAIRTTGAYGEVMASQYNLRDKVKAIFSE